MNINFIAVGKLKESYFREACDEYKKRISAYANVKVFEPEPAFLPQDPSRAQISQALAKEAEKISGYARGYKIALCIEGKTLSSEGLSEKIRDISEISFIVGSSYGLSEEFKRECDFRLSMSEMTFAHSLARVMLFEQVYRAMSISANGKYHK